MKRPFLAGKQHHNRILAAKLRKNMTLPEKKIWEILKNQQIMGLPFFPCVVVHDAIANFFCKPLKLVIDVDKLGYNPRYERERDFKLHLKGYKVYRIRASVILNDFKAASELIKTVVLSRKEEIRRQNYEKKPVIKKQTFIPLSRKVKHSVQIITRHDHG